MRRAKVYVDSILAGYLEEVTKGKEYCFRYLDHYEGASVSLTMPTAQKIYRFSTFPPFFDGLLPEGMQLESLLKCGKIDRDDLFQQLLTVGGDLIGNITVEEVQ